MTLGEKIRARRRSLGMTQKDVAGDCVTRNMICCIERGDVSPSLATLNHIAGMLSVPVSYLVSEADDYDVFLAQEALPKIREAFRENRFSDCMTIIRRLPEESRIDEIALLAVSALVELAEKSVTEGNLHGIPALCKEAEKYAARTVLPVSHLLARSELCRSVARNPQAPKWEIGVDRYCSLVNDAVRLEQYRYLAEVDTFPVYDRLLIDHMRAKSLISSRRYADALILLSGIEDRKGSERISSYLLFRIYADTEICYRELGDYENAYRYSTKRISLLNAFQT